MNRSYYFIVPFMLILIIATAEMATAIYTPSLSTVAGYYHVSEAIAQWTVSINLLGLALSGPIYGPWSDCYGRRTVLRIGMGLFLLGSLLSLAANSINVLLAARFVQGLGAGVAVVVAFAVVRDLFDEKKSAQVLSYMGMAIALSPGLAPVLGGYLTHHHGWKMCFGFVSFVAAILVLLLFFWMPETLPEKKRSHFSLKNIGRGYKKVFQNNHFLALSLIPCLMIGALWALISGLPVLFTGYLDVPIKHYGYYGFSGVAFYILGTFINSKLVHTFALKTLLLGGLCFCFISTTLLMGAGYKEVNNPLILQALCWPFPFGLAFILPNGTALAFSEVQEGLGTSSALLGSLEMALGAFGVFLVGQFFKGTIIPIAMIMLGGTVLSLCLYSYLRVTDINLKSKRNSA
ncbi:MAG: multidrug effflux MFS transporter [Alphaproteobacteria bacterium]|nr:multidrug effflux MFS transporter [Alphaproteobacteria bacterium]